MSDEEDYFVPLEDQRIFGAGIRRKRVPFIRSSEHELNTTTSFSKYSTEPTPDTGTSIANKYLSIVLPKDKQPHPTPETSHSAPPSPSLAPRCEVCNLPIRSRSQNQSQPLEESEHSQEEEGRGRGGSVKPHEASLAHQLCLAHSHPPSHLDRTRHGLRYLSAYGWDPDSRVGLGMPGREGIREPVKGQLKRDTVGLGVDLDELASRRVQAERKDKVQKLNARQVRKAHAQDRKKGDKLREMFYRSEDLQRYLGEAYIDSG